MTNSKDEYDDHENAWPFEEVMNAGRAAARAQQQRLQEYISENNPSLTAALAAETARFDIMSRTMIEPVMREAADGAAQRGWHASVSRDDELDRLAVFGTPGIRFYCSRQPSHTAAGDLIWPPSFVAFYGCAQSLAVRTHAELTELNEDAVSSSGNLLFEYPEVTSEAVRAVLAAFLADLERIS